MRTYAYDSSPRIGEVRREGEVREADMEFMHSLLSAGSDNQGVVPTSALLRIDQLLDDGNLATGEVRGNALGFLTAVGELVIRIRL